MISHLHRLAQGSAVVTLSVAAIFLATLRPAGAMLLDRDTVVARAELAARYLLVAQRPDGLFRYEFDFVRREDAKGDNIVRQAAGATVLGEYLLRTSDRTFAAPVVSALDALSDRSLPYGHGLVVAKERSLKTAVTGATALALAGAVDHFAATRDPRSEALARAWLRGLAALQLQNGGFAQAPGTEKQSSYYDGEAWFAAARFVQVFPGDATAETILARADSYLMEHYGRSPDGAFAHWGLMAASVRYDATRDPRVLDFVESLAASFINDLRPSISAEANSCSAVEGLADAAATLHAGGRAATDLYSRIVVRLDAEMAKSLDLQIMPGETRLPLADGSVVEEPQVADFAGAFLGGRFKARTRIDDTQHCLSALMRYGRLLAVFAADR